MNKRFIIGFVLLAIAFLSMQGQNVTVKSVSLLQNDLEARTQPRNDKNGEPCAIIKVGIVGVEDLQFPDAVGDVKYGASEYVVYVPSGLKTLKYQNANRKLSGEVKLENDYGIDIEKQRTYRLLLDTEDHFRAAVFSVNPPTAKLTVDEQDANLDDSGMATLKLPIGSHSYKVEAKGYYSTSKYFELIDDELSQMITVDLIQRTQHVSIAVQPTNATVFIDNIPIETNTSGIYRMELGEGQHLIRLTAENFKDVEKKIDISGSSSKEFSFTMGQTKTEVITHDEEKSKTAFNIRNFSYTNVGFEVYDKNKFYGYSGGLKLETGGEFHFIRILAFRFGLAGGYASIEGDDDNEENVAADWDVDFNGWWFEVPASIGIIIPFYYNKHHFSAHIGGYYRWGVLDDDEDEKVKVETMDYGLRLQSYLFFHKFSIGAELRKSLMECGIYGGITIGFKIGR